MRARRSGRRKYWVGPLLAVLVVIGIVLLASGRLRWTCPFVVRRDRPSEARGDLAPANPFPDFLPGPSSDIGEPVREAIGAASARRRSARLTEIEGIGPIHADKLRSQGLRTSDDLLRAGSNPGGRHDLAATTGVSDKLVVRWVKQADLLRIKGVGGEYAELLQAAGVDTVSELAQSRAGDMVRKMAEVNEEEKLVRRIPTESQVTAWIEAAKNLPRVVSY